MKRFLENAMIFAMLAAVIIWMCIAVHLRENWHQYPFLDFVMFGR